MERKQASNRYLLSGEGKGQDWSEHGKKNKLAIGTYSLERAKVRTGQDMERKQASNKNLQTGEGKGQDWSGHGKKTS